MYFQGERNSDENSQIALTQNQRKPYRVQISDILSIRVKALDQETVDIFNPLPLIIKITINLIRLPQESVLIMTVLR